MCISVHTQVLIFWVKEYRQNPQTATVLRPFFFVPYFSFQNTKQLCNSYLLSRALSYLEKELLDFYYAAIPSPPSPFTFHVNNEDQDSHLVICFQELELKENPLSITTCT